MHTELKYYACACSCAHTRICAIAHYRDFSLFAITSVTHPSTLCLFTSFCFPFSPYISQLFRSLSKNNTSFSVKQHVIFDKTTRRFQ